MKNTAPFGIPKNGNFPLPKNVQKPLSQRTILHFALHDYPPDKRVGFVYTKPKIAKVDSNPWIEAENTINNLVANHKPPANKGET